MAAEKKTATPTEYIVLRELRTGTTTSWQRIQSAKATSASAAIRAVVGKLSQNDQAGSFVAVPVRSWRPVTVQPQTTIRLELTEAKP